MVPRVQGSPSTRERPRISIRVPPRRDARLRLSCRARDAYREGTEPAYALGLYSDSSERFNDSMVRVRSLLANAPPRLHESHHAEQFTLRDVVNDRRVLVRFEAVPGPRLHHVGAEPPQGLPGTRSATAAGSRLFDRGRCPSSWHRSRWFLGREGPQRFGPTGGTSPCGASTFRNHPGRPIARTPRRPGGRSSCAIRTEPSQCLSSSCPYRAVAWRSVCHRVPSVRELLVTPTGRERAGRFGMYAGRIRQTWPNGWYRTPRAARDSRFAARVDGGHLTAVRVSYGTTSLIPSRT